MTGTIGPVSCEYDAGDSRRLKVLFARCSPRGSATPSVVDNYQDGRWPIHRKLLHNGTLGELENCGRSKGQASLPISVSEIPSSRSRSITWSALANSVFPRWRPLYC